MRALHLTLSLLAAGAVAGCTCSPVATNLHFSCATGADCADGYACRGGECRSTSGPPGPCVAGETRSCSNAACVQACGGDGGFQECTPKAGEGFSSNPDHCGQCGRACAKAAGFTCVNSRCTCGADGDCPSGDVCGPAGICVTSDDPCGALRCTAGQVCRQGSCAPVDCDGGGCGLLEVCEAATGRCRAIDACLEPQACDGGFCEGGARPDGQPCDDGVACTFGDRCASGACGGTTYSCPAMSQCQQAGTCLGDGGCAVVNQRDGLACDDGVDCTSGDHCTSGVCAGTAYTCTPGACTATSICAGDGGCFVTPRNVGAACDDGNPCTVTDRCGDAGLCLGTTYTCPAPTTCQQSVACAGDGGCLVTNKADGAACDDGLACTPNDTCLNAVCVGSGVATTYLDSDGDGRGDSNLTSTMCPAPAGYVAVGGDCNDADPDVFQTLQVVADVDQDGVTAGTALSSQCVGTTSVVGGRTYYKAANGAFTWAAAASAASDCDDANANVFQMVSVIADTDQDGYGASSSSVAARCVGDTSTVGGRTYYRAAGGAYTWLLGTANLGSDCNDTTAAVTGATSFYADTDGDGFGAGAAVQQCAVSAGLVANNTDCNDASANVFTNRSVYLDADQDGYTDNAVATQCTGSSTVVNGRTYFKNAAGAFTWIATSLGADCNTSNAALFQTVNNVVADNDRDGYPPNNTQSSVCAGATSTVGTRTYYASATAGNYWLAKAGCINYQMMAGGNCVAPFDCYDSNANANPVQAAYFTADRGDGSFDYNCSGTITSNTALATYCAPGGSQTFYTDGACTAGAFSATLCSSTPAVAFPAACGLYGPSAGDFYNPGACTPASFAGATQIACH